MATTSNPRWRKLYSVFWRNPGVGRLNGEEKLVALYCLTGPQANRIGLYALSPALAAEDLGMTPQSFLRRLGAVCGALSWKFDKTGRVLYIPSWWRWNCPDNPEVMARRLRDLHELPKTPLLGEFAKNQAYLGDSVSRVFREIVVYQEPEQEPEQEIEATCCEAAPPVEEKPKASHEQFGRFWNVYPKRNGRRVGKKAAWERFGKLSPEDAEAAIVAARNYAASDLVDRGFAKDAERFLKGDYWRDWTDAAEPVAAPSRVATDEDLAHYNPTDGGPGLRQ